MFATVMEFLAGWIVSVISTLGYAGIVALMAIESACIPLPSEIIMPFSGYLVFTGRFQLIWVATAGALGCNVGSAVAYAVGYWGGRPLAEKWGHYVLMSRHELDRVDHFFKHYGDITVLVCRLLPVVRTFIALPAGIARMPQLRFHVYTFIGSWPWCFGLAYVGYKLGERWDSDPELKAFMHRFDFLILAVILLGLAWYIRRLWRHRKQD